MTNARISLTAALLEHMKATGKTRAHVNDDAFINSDEPLMGGMGYLQMVERGYDDRELYAFQTSGGAKALARYLIKERKKRGLDIGLEPQPAPKLPQMQSEPKLQRPAFNPAVRAVTKKPDR